MRIELKPFDVAHGGWCVARRGGRVVFVSGAIPGEVVEAEVTEQRAKLWRAVTTRVLEPSPDRVEHIWPDAAGPEGVGGADLGHVRLPAQRAWKAEVVRQQLARIAHIDRKVTVEAAPGDDAAGGLGWRTRLELEVDDAGRPGMFRARTHDIVPVHELPLAVPAIQEAGILGLEWNPGDRLRVVAPSGEPGEAYVLSHTSPGGPRWVTERVVAAAPDDGPEPWSMTYRVQTGGFWQMHRASPAVLVTAALSGIGEAVDGDWWRRAARPGAGRTGHVETPMTGLTVWDLYSGAGLFSVPLARLVGESGHVEAVEADRGGAEAARRNLAAYGWARSRRAKVEAALPALPRPDIVLLDPPRTGAGTKVCRALADAGPRVIGYVACDPAALARDLAVLTGAGYRIRTLRGFDLFPHTHHVECVAVLAR